jgi:thymidylate kinase
MADIGRLVVLEGPDGVGKSTLSKAVTVILESRGVPCKLTSFPGREDGTLGRHVYSLHHDPAEYGIKSLSPESLQLLHVAAHLDSILNRILPAIRSGTWVILDRFWWSTWAYGLVSGIDRKLLDSIIEIERAAWRGIVPTPMLVVRRDSPFRLENDSSRHLSLTEAYDEIARIESKHYPVHILENDEDEVSLVESAIRAIDGIRFRTSSSASGLSRRPGKAATQALEIDNLFTGSTVGPQYLKEAADRQPRATFTIITPISPAQPTDVYETYWRFAAERQEIFFRRIDGESPLTNDPILARHKFTNAYRASDRVSQFLIRDVIYRGPQESEEVFFRTILFKLFNKISTWKLLERSFGTPCWREFKIGRYDAVLETALLRGEKIYSAAYIMPSGSGAYEDRRKHRSHMQLLEAMMREKLAHRISECRSMRQAFELIRSYQMIGDFLAYQFVTDVNYSIITDFSESEFVIPGPGARDGIRKCFKSLGGLDESGIMGFP